MRPVDKGDAPHTYHEYGEARHDLAKRIGYYCSCCEMPTFNMIEVEHIHSINNGGNPLDWNNFLLSCKYCNTVKGCRNDNRKGYLWPDIDNTDLAFEYSQINVIEPKRTLPTHIRSLATSTINLMGLNRIPGGTNQPTPADTRWRSPKEAWIWHKKAIQIGKKLPLKQWQIKLLFHHSTATTPYGWKCLKPCPWSLKKLIVNMVK